MKPQAGVVPRRPERPLTQALDEEDRGLRGGRRAMIPMTGTFGDLVVYQNENGEYMKLTAGATVDRVHLMLRDEKGRSVDLQEQSWLIELEII